MRQYKFLMPGQWNQYSRIFFAVITIRSSQACKTKDFLQDCEELFSQTVQIMLGQQSEII